MLGRDGWILKSINERVDCFERPTKSKDFINVLGKGIVELSVEDIANFLWGKKTSFDERHCIAKNLDLYFLYSRPLFHLIVEGD